MADLVRGKATICVVNYKTLDMTRLCLRAIRLFTTYSHEVMVVDNNSQDDSLAYLRTMPWIRLIERTPTENDEVGGHAHAAALDLGLSKCRTEFFVSLHSDSVVLQADWLSRLVCKFDEAPEPVLEYLSAEVNTSEEWTDGKHRM